MLTDKQLHTRTDEELMEELKRGRQEALGFLFDRYYRLVFSVALKILRDRGEAEDLMQEVFIEIYRRIEVFNPDKGSAKTWILQYAYHRSLNRQKYLTLRNFYDQTEETDLESHEFAHSMKGWNGLTYQDWGLSTIVFQIRIRIPEPVVPVPLFSVHKRLMAPCRLHRSGRIRRRILLPPRAPRSRRGDCARTRRDPASAPRDTRRNENPLPEQRPLPVHEPVGGSSCFVGGRDRLPQNLYRMTRGPSGCMADLLPTRKPGSGYLRFRVRPTHNVQ